MGDHALIVDITILNESKSTSLADMAAEKIRKHQQLKDQIQELTNAKDIKFNGFLMGACGKWYQGNYKVLKTLGLSNSRQEKVACYLLNKALFTSVDIMCIFMSQSRTTVRT